MAIAIGQFVSPCTLPVSPGLFSMTPSILIKYSIACNPFVLSLHSHALQDIRDDIKLGLKSTAIKFGSNGKYWLSSFAASTSLLLLASGCQASLSWPYLFGVAAVSCHFAWQVTLF